MNIYDILLLISTLCGVLMVTGGILLLYKGTISLNNISGKDAFTIEYKKELRVTTRYPALGFFIIGLAFVAFPVWTAKPKFTTVVVRAQAVNVSEPASIALKPNTWKSDLLHTGSIEETFHPNMDNIQVEISAPGYQPHIQTFRLSSLKNSTADLGNIEMRQAVARESIKPGSIMPIPAGMKLAPKTARGAFGGTL